jgi:hypothetical protein
MLKNMAKKEFMFSIIENKNVTCHLLKVLMMKCGYNKILMAIVKLILDQMDVKKTQNNLHMIIISYINKYSKFYI